MRVRYAFVAISAALIASTFPTFAQSVSGQSTTTSTCDDSMVSGQYAAHGAGSIGAAAPFTPEQVVAIRSFDGNGSFSGHGRQSRGGTSYQVTGTGTYTVHSDCTITMAGKRPNGTPLHWFGVIADNGNNIYLIRTDPGITASVTLNRIAPIS